MMLEEPLPGGREEDCGTDDGPPRGRVVNTNVTTARSYDAVRQKVVQSASNYLGERLALEQENIVTVMRSLVGAGFAKDFVAAQKHRPWPVRR